MTPIPVEVARAFVAGLWPVALAECPPRGRDPRACVESAAKCSSFGRFAMGHNFWGLRGHGDAGFVVTVVPVHTAAGWRSAGERLAKFKSPRSAVIAWCLRG